MKIAEGLLRTPEELPEGFINKVKSQIESGEYKKRLAADAIADRPVLTTTPANGNKRLSLTREEGNFLKSFRLEEYVALTNKMKNDDPEAYKAHIKALQTAEDSGNISRKLSEMTRPYSWAYGDALGKVKEEYPKLDIFIKSEGTPEDYTFINEYQKKNGSPYLIVSTDELRLLQSKAEADKENQNKLWKALKKRINSLS